MITEFSGLGSIPAAQALQRKGLCARLFCWIQMKKRFGLLPMKSPIKKSGRCWLLSNGNQAELEEQ